MPEQKTSTPFEPAAPNRELVEEQQLDPVVFPFDLFKFDSEKTAGYDLPGLTMQDGYLEVPIKGVVFTGMVAGENISARDIVAINNSGQIVKADKSNPDKVHAVGYATTSVTSGYPVRVATKGKIYGFTGLTPRLPIYLGAAGGYHQDLLSHSTSDYVVFMGIALSATEVEITVGSAILYAKHDSPTYEELQGGYSEAGGTTTPSVPTISTCEAVGTKGILIEWDTQLNLTNFSHYEVQVSANQSDWYSLRFDGVEWYGTLNQWTSIDIPYLVHTGIPHAGTAEAPTGRTLYYRVRRVNKDDPAVKSNYSASANATTKTVAAGDLAQNSIYTNNLQAGCVKTAKIYAGAVDTDQLAAGAVTAAKIDTTALEAQFANISYQLTIGFYGTGSPSSPNVNDVRVYLDEDQINFQRWTGATWENRLSLYPNYIENPSSGLYLGGNGVSNILGLGIGDNFTYFARAFRFNRTTISGTTSLGDTAVLVECNSASAAFTATLPSPTAGRFMIIRKYAGAEDGTRDVTVSPSSGSILLDGQAYASLELRFIGQEMWLVGNGTNWNRVNGPRWFKVIDPAINWFASKTTGWTQAQFTPGGFNVDFSGIVPTGTRAVRCAYYILNSATAHFLWYRKAGDTAIANDPSNGAERSAYVHATPDRAGEQAEWWLSTSYRVEFAVAYTDADLYLAYPVEYLV